MVDRSRSPNIALLIDADNASPQTLEQALTLLAELGTVNVRRIYGNWSKAALKGWAQMTHLYALEPQQQFDVTKGKSATDMKMTIDAMDLLARGQVDGFGIMSSDSDFMPLAMRIRQDGLPVYGFGTAKTPISFQQACTRFIDVGALVDRKADEPSTARPAVDPALVDLLGDAIRASDRDERGFASLSEVGQRASARSSFDARSYGYNRLSELVRAIPNFATEKRDDGRVYVKRVR
ncbi:NYN domain-containing protein [Sphingosinicella terrae]|uniref:NYN domain-containing protein n=1 Tax=Sphingosinicella terrae TaxID=2172047 RepID=UPI000E0CCE97|nr:NYN domain-containing protein [Sphingosinicella terrae]